MYKINLSHRRFFHHIPRDDANGGDVGFLEKKSIQIRKQSQTNFRSFEYLDLLLKYPRGCIRVVTVYRPPPSKENGLMENDFLMNFLFYWNNWL